MNIYSKSISDVNFISAIAPALLKHSREYRVLATLRYLFPGRFENMIVADAPDLQDGSIGIEVVAAVKNEDAQAERLFSYYHNPRPNESPATYKEGIEALGYSIQDSGTAPILVAPLGDTNCEELVIKNAIRKKTAKTKRYRSKCASLGLALILPEIPTSEAESNIPLWIQQAIPSNDDKFDFVFVICERFCIYYDGAANHSSRLPINAEENQRLQKIGRMTAEGKLTIGSPEWTIIMPEAPGIKC